MNDDTANIRKIVIAALGEDATPTINFRILRDKLLTRSVATTVARYIWRFLVVALIVRPILVAWRQLREQIVAFDKAIRALVRSNSACQLLMSVPGVGVLSALVYVSTVEDPARFVRSRCVGAHLGLTPRQYQSGEVDRSGRISKCGDTLARALMYEVAGVILTRLKRASSLKDWAQAIVKRSGAGKARVALARKLSVILRGRFCCVEWVKVFEGH